MSEKKGEGSFFSRVAALSILAILVMALAPFVIVPVRFYFQQRAMIRQERADIAQLKQKMALSLQIGKKKPYVKAATIQGAIKTLYEETIALASPLNGVDLITMSPEPASKKHPLRISFSLNARVTQQGLYDLVDALEKKHSHLVITSFNIVSLPFRASAHESGASGGHKTIHVNLELTSIFIKTAR